MADGAQLSNSDALIWRIEGDPVLRSPILVVGLLDRPPSRVRVRAALERASEAIPGFRQRLDPGHPWSKPRWVDDGSFCLDHHLRHVRAAQGDLPGVLELAAPDAVAAFDPARPLWQMTLVDELDDGGAAFVLRFHHTITDGVGGIGLAEDLFEPTRRGRRAGAPPAARPEPDEDGDAPVSRTPADAVQRAARLAGEMAQGALGAALDPAGTVRSGTRVARSVAKMLAPARAPLSPILQGRSLDRHLEVLELPLRDLRAVARATGGTVNDVFLAAVGKGLHEHHRRAGTPLEAIRLTMPISLRVEGDERGGNHFTPARFVLPIAEPDPRRRIEQAGAIVRSWRAEPAVGMTPLLAAGLALLPRPLVQRAFAGMLRSIDVDAVDVPGLQHPAYLGGARVDRLWAFAPPTGAALSITLVSHLEQACVGILADTAAVTDPQGLRACLAAGFDDVRTIID
jgi:WS/DGAT/MGAT family acyltransferase